jgi:DNA-binding HxlR family transcriptional regulator
MVKRSYGQYCGLARALEIVGERWALLIVRDLLVSPRRFTDLHRGLPGIPTNVLTARLKELEASGIVRRRLLPRPENAVVYELTEYGAELEAPVMALARWGARALGEPAAGEVVTPESLVMALRSTFRPEAARGARIGYELHVNGIVVHARVGGRGRNAPNLQTGVGPLPGPDLVIETGPAIRALMSGAVRPEEALAEGLVRVTGDPALLARFVEVFAIDPAGPELAVA